MPAGARSGSRKSQHRRPKLRRPPTPRRPKSRPPVRLATILATGTRPERTRNGANRNRSPSPEPEPEPEPEPGTGTRTGTRVSIGSASIDVPIIARRAHRVQPARAVRAPSQHASATPPKAARPDTARFWSRTVPVIAGSLALLVGVGAVVRAVENDPDSKRAATHGTTPPIARTLLLVHHSELFGNDLIVLFGSDRATGSVLLIPGATQVDVPSLGVATLSAMSVDDNGARLANSVENVVGVGVGRTVVLDDAGLTAVLGPAAPFPITLSGPVDILVPESKYNAGAQEVSAAQAAQLLSGPQSVNELDRLVTASAVLEGWLTRLKDPAVAKRTLALQGDLGPLVSAATAAEHRIDTLPVDSISMSGGERFVVREAELIKYVQAGVPGWPLGLRARSATGRGVERNGLPRRCAGRGRQGGSGRRQGHVDRECSGLRRADDPDRVLQGRMARCCPTLARCDGMRFASQSR